MRQNQITHLKLKFSHVMIFSALVFLVGISNLSLTLLWSSCISVAKSSMLALLNSFYSKSLNSDTPLGFIPYMIASILYSYLVNHYIQIPLTVESDPTDCDVQPPNSSKNLPKFGSLPQSLHPSEGNMLS
jgi:hypothetical protein